MAWLRILILATAALGATWAAEQIARSAARAPVAALAQVDTGAVPDAPGSPAPAVADEDDGAGDPQSPPVELKEVSPEEIEAELARIEAAVEGSDTEDLGEFTPSKPLVADLPIDLPSDI